MNFEKFLRKRFLRNNSGRLLLTLMKDSLMNEKFIIAQLIFLFVQLTFVVVNIVAIFGKTNTILLSKETVTDIPSKQYRCSHRSCFAKKDVLKKFANFTAKHRCWSLF